MTQVHVVALFFGLMASTGFMLAFAIVWANWKTDLRVMDQFAACVHSLTAVGLIGVIAVLWKDAIVSSLRSLTGDSRPDDTAKHSIFASMRFANGQPLPEALILRDALQARGVFLKIVELAPGADINEEVFQSIEQASAFLVFGTANYGEKTANPACTYYESEFARNSGKKIILLRMIPFDAQFQHMQARVMFGMSDLVPSWMEEMAISEDIAWPRLSYTE